MTEQREQKQHKVLREVIKTGSGLLLRMEVKVKIDG